MKSGLAGSTIAAGDSAVTSTPTPYGDGLPPETVIAPGHLIAACARSAGVAAATRLTPVAASAPSAPSAADVAGEPEVPAWIRAA